MDYRDYLVDLASRFYLIPLPCTASSMDEVKQVRVRWQRSPLAIKREALAMARAGHRCFAIYLRKSGLFCIDLDVKEQPSISQSDVSALDNKLADMGVYVERTPSGGRHYIFSFSGSGIVRVQTAGIYRRIVDYKHEGLVTIYPSEFNIDGKIYRYEHIAGDLRNTPNLMDIHSDVARAFKETLGIPIRFAISDKRIGVDSLSSIQNSIPRLATAPADIDDQKLTEIVRDVFDKASCRGFATLLDYKLRGEPIPVYKEMETLMSNPRTSRFLFMYMVAYVLKMISIPRERALAYLRSLTFIDSDRDPVRDSYRSAIYNVYDNPVPRLIPSGTCKFCDYAGLEPCMFRDPVKLLEKYKLDRALLNAVASRSLKKSVIEKI